MFIKKLSIVWVLSLSLLTPVGYTTESNASKININTAPIDVLDTQLVDIGPKKAQAIVDYREKHGPFKSLDELRKVFGIGDKVIESNKEKIIFSDPTPVEATTPVTKTEPAKDKTPAVSEPAKEPTPKPESTTSTPTTP
jgi:competence protein ComEA